MPATGDRITKRKDGRYMARYTVETPDGSKRKAIYGKDYKGVETKLITAMGDAARGLIFDTQGVTVGEYLSRWLSESVRDTVRESTYNSYGRAVNGQLVPRIGRVKLDKLRPDQIRRLYCEMLGSGLATRTVQYAHTLLKRALMQAVMDGLIPRNPAAAVRPPQLRRKEMRPLSAEQVRALLDTAADRSLALYTVAVHTGMRPGELLALR